MNEVLKDLMSEIGLEVANLEYLIGHSQVDNIVDGDLESILNVEQLKGRRDMALMIMDMVRERME